MEKLVTAATVQGSVKRKLARWRRYLIWYLFIAPNITLFLIFGLLPIIATVLISFTRWNILGSPMWIGLDNFQRLTHDNEFWTSLRVTLTYAVLFVLPSAAIALGQALLISLAGRWQAFFRTIYFIPVVTSITVIAMIWGWLFLPDNTGPLNYLLGIFGIPPQSWLQSLTQALPSVTLVAVWSAVGYYMVLWLSGLQGIPQELLDAAMVDGANTWTRFWRVTLPLLRPTTMFIIVIGTINAFQAFTLFYLLTGGGPLYETTTIVLFIYKHAFRLQEMGYASAASMVLVVITLIATLVQRRAIGGWSDELYS
jgi:multiple sugar transport system permease protein